MKKGFTLIEMLVVIGIIAVLLAATLGVYSGATKAAERSRCQELVLSGKTMVDVEVVAFIVVVYIWAYVTGTARS